MMHVPSTRVPWVLRRASSLLVFSTACFAFLAGMTAAGAPQPAQLSETHSCGPSCLLHSSSAFFPNSILPTSAPPQSKVRLSKIRTPSASLLASPSPPPEKRPAAKGLLSLSEAVRQIGDGRTVPTALYLRQGCPYCHKVTQWMAANAVDLKAHGVAVRQVRNNQGQVTDHGRLLLAKTNGKMQVPALELSSTGILLESDHIVLLLKRLYVEPTVGREEA
eukprot:GHVT01063876.1.p1 GENE.GHVT01063876.1~~GHVT01063876.1.p1  ORF type:complete len:220 (+),score=51.78 GHVT01063876.1:65-724(+)